MKLSDILDSIDELEDADDLDLEDHSSAVSGELIELDDIGDLEDYEMDEHQAQEITDAIRSTATAIFILIAEAHKHKAHKALGYETWEDYVRQEFDMTASRSYQLLNLSKTVEEIESVTPEGTEIKLTEAQARDIKRELPRITELIREETVGLTPEEAAARAAAVVEEQRDEMKQQKKDEDKAKADKQKEQDEADAQARSDMLEGEADKLLEADQSGGFTDDAEDGMLDFEVSGSEGSISQEDSMNLYNFFNILTTIENLPEPDEFVNVVPEARMEEISQQLLTATAWLNRFSTLWDVRVGLKEDSE